MTLTSGKLYVCPEYYLMLYPNLECIEQANLTAIYRSTGSRDWSSDVDSHAAASNAAFWINELKKPVTYTEKGSPLLILNTSRHYAEVLAGDKVGWINILHRFIELNENIQ